MGPSAIGQGPADVPIPAVEAAGAACLDALLGDLRTDRDSYGLRTAVTQQGARIIDVMAQMLEGGRADFPPRAALASALARERLLIELTSQVDVYDGTITSATVRPAAVATLDKLIKAAASKERDRDRDRLVDEELFCVLYRFFFADAITQFLTGVIAAKVVITVPALVAVDPAGLIAEHLAAKIAEAIPTPCEEKSQRGSKESVGDIAREMVGQAFDGWVDTALGQAA